jgi:hypothetical protein
VQAERNAGFLPGAPLSGWILSLFEGVHGLQGW